MAQIPDILGTLGDTCVYCVAYSKTSSIFLLFLYLDKVQNEHSPLIMNLVCQTITAREFTCYPEI